MSSTEQRPFRVETVVEILRQEGLRITKGRLGILHCLMGAAAPLSLQEIQEGARAHGGAKPDYATVFRTIALMEKLHLVHRVNLQRPCTYFELNDPRKHYDHLICKKCRNVVLLDLPCPLKNFHREIEKRFGFRQISHSLEFFGLCPACALSAEADAS